MKLDLPATDFFDDEIATIGDELEGLLDEDFGALVDTDSDSLDGIDTDDETEGPPVEEDTNWPLTTATSAEMKDLSLVLDDWDPVRFELEQTSPQCLSRVLHDLMNLINNPLTGVYTTPVELDCTRIHALVVGPPGTPYEGGFFHFLMQCPPDYPMRPPRVRLMNTDDQTVSFNPNLYDSGMVCLDILGTSDTFSWSPAFSISSVLVSIQSLLTEKPYFNDTHWSSDERPEDCETYSLIVQHETIRVAVCGAVEACLNGSSPCPPFLRHVMVRVFLACFDNYEKAVETRLELTGEEMIDPLCFQTYERGRYDYKTLLARLHALKPAVEEVLKVRLEDH
ncbi:hypothetical protein MTO96_011156 [Rhipicephalus appendiculatus]